MNELAERFRRAMLNLRPATNLLAEPASLEARMRQYGVPGVSIAVLMDNRAQSFSFGLKEAGQAGAVGPDTMFQAASISKPVFALAVMRLVERGKLDLDADIRHYLGSDLVRASADWQPHLTLRQLLSHRAGLTVHGFPGYPAGAALPSLVQVLRGEEPANTKPVVVDIIPGQQFRYSGGGTTLAQLIVESVLGKQLPQIMDELILHPLGLKQSTYAQPLPARFEQHAASGHLSSGQVVVGKWHTYPEAAAAGLWTTPSDLVRLGNEVQASLRGESKLFSQTMIEEMLTPNLTDFVPMADAIGIGFFLNGTGSCARFLHGGSNHGYLSRLTMYKQSSQGAAIMVNSDRGRGLICEIEMAIAAEFGWAGYLPLPGQQLAGVYRSRAGHQFEIRHDAGSLALQVMGQPPLQLAAGTAEHQFSVIETGAAVHFQLDARGEVGGLRLMQPGRTIEAERERAGIRN
ncbi:MAG: serine hydrolase domain-containing protein [Bacillota bacterium]